MLDSRRKAIIEFISGEGNSDYVIGKLGEIFYDDELYTAIAMADTDEDAIDIIIEYFAN